MELVQCKPEIRPEGWMLEIPNNDRAKKAQTMNMEVNNDSKRRDI